MIRAYLQIQQMRYGQTLKCKIETFPGMGNYISLKQLYQPIIENAVIHGFEKNRETIACISASVILMDGCASPYRMTASACRRNGVLRSHRKCLHSIRFRAAVTPCAIYVNKSVLSTGMNTG